MPSILFLLNKCAPSGGGEKDAIASSDITKASFVTHQTKRQNVTLALGREGCSYDFGEEPA